MSSIDRTRVGSAVSRHLATLLFYAALSVAISWPLAANLTTAITGGGLDALSHLWGVWHAVQAFAGREPLFSTDLLYYPAGASLLLHSAGPMTGLLALPFWPLGPVAGYNGGLLIGLTLTGYAMYLLARDIECSQPASIVAGIVLLAAPVHLVGLRGHLAKVFLGLMPLACLALRRSLDRRRSAMWSAAFALSVLLLLLHSPFQFVQIALVSPLLVLTAMTRRAERGFVVRRALMAAGLALVVSAPLLVATARAAADPAMAIDKSAESASHQPDVSQFVLPPSFSAIFGEQTATVLQQWNVSPEIETEVSIPIVALGLAVAAGIVMPGTAGPWTAIAIGAVTLALGPTVLASGRSWPAGGAPVMPYTWITALPGLDFLRTPPRFMQVGFVGIAAAAAIGLAQIARNQTMARLLATIAGLLVLVEIWPVAWPNQPLPPAPAFYQRIAGDGEMYGVLDLPVKPLPDVSPQDYSARYQALQLVHQKGIAGGYVSRVYARHPVSPCIFAEDRAPNDVRVNGVPSRCEPAAIHQLATSGYRFVVWHQPSDQNLENRPGSWAAQDAQAFISAAFGGQPPVSEEPLARVWRLPPAKEALPSVPVVELGPGWYPAEPAWRWAASPAALTITAPRSEEVELSLSIRLVHDRTASRGLGEHGVLIVTAGRQSVSRAFTVGDVARVPLSLAAGPQTVSLALGAGNFRPIDIGESDPRPLAFAVERVELTTKQEKGPGVISR